MVMRTSGCDEKYSYWLIAKTLPLVVNSCRSVEKDNMTGLAGNIMLSLRYECKRHSGKMRLSGPHILYYNTWMKILNKYITEKGQEEQIFPKFTK